jgi:hypothetical protein
MKEAIKKLNRSTEDCHPSSLIPYSLTITVSFILYKYYIPFAMTGLDIDLYIYIFILFILIAHQSILKHIDFF